MNRHLPATIAFAVSLAAGSAMLARAPSTDVDAITDTPAAEVQDSSAGKYLGKGDMQERGGTLRPMADPFSSSSAQRRGR